MSTLKAIFFKILAITLLLAISACSTLKNAGQNVVDGAFYSLETNQHVLDSLVDRLSNKIINSALEGVSSIDLTAYEDDISSVLKGAIKEGLLNDKNQNDLENLIDKLLLRIDHRLVTTVGKLPKELFNDELINRISVIRDSLLGQGTKKQLTELVRSSLSPTEELKDSLVVNVKGLIDYARENGEKGISFIVKCLISGAILIILVLGLVIYLVRRKLGQYKRGLLVTTCKIDLLDRENYEKTKLKSADFGSSPETYKAINDLIKENEELFENKKKYRNYLQASFNLLINSISKKYGEAELKELIGNAEKHSPELAKFLGEELKR